MKPLTRDEIEDLMHSPLARDFRVIAVRLKNSEEGVDADPSAHPIPDWAHRVLRERGARFADFLLMTVPVDWESGEEISDEERRRRAESQAFRDEVAAREAELAELRDKPIAGPNGELRECGAAEHLWLDEYVSQALTFRNPGSRARALALCDEYYHDDKVFTLERLIRLMVDYGQMMRLKESASLN